MLASPGSLTVNGVLVNQQTDISYAPSDWMTAGGTRFFNGHQGFFSGEIDEVRVWNFPRSVKEIRDAMHTPLSGSETGLVGYWNFDEGSGQQVSDLSSSGVTGVLGTNSSEQSSDPEWVDSGAPIRQIPQSGSSDLTISNLDKSSLVYDGQGLTVTEKVTATITNVGDTDVSDPFDVLFFEDRNNNSVYDPGTDEILGQSTFNGTLLARQSVNFSANLSGSVLFSENLIWGFVDSGDVIAESDESNNLANCGESCVTEGSSDTGLVTWREEDGGNGHTYQAVLASGPEGITWTDANAAAEALGNGWHLATITSQEENDFVFALVTGKPDFWNCCESGNSAGPWLGGIKVGPGVGDYEWVTGETFEYTNWGPREPFGNGERIGLFGFQAAEGPFWNDIGPEDRVAFSYILETDQPVTQNPVFVPAPDLTASFVQVLKESNEVKITARIGNGGANSVPAGSPVSFYDGNPASGGILLGTVATTVNLQPGQFEDVELALPVSTSTSNTIWVVADDSGGLVGSTTECKEANNPYDSGLKLVGGPVLVLVPDVVTYSQEDAESKISGAGLEIGEVSMEYSDEVEAGLVIRQSPMAGEEVEEGSSVNIVISLGPLLITDLTISDVDKSKLSYDGQALTVIGDLFAKLTNRGTVDINAPFAVLFYEDTNNNQIFDPDSDQVLGQFTQSAPLAAGESVTVSVALSGPVLFKGNLIWGFVDSDEAIAEDDEDNNEANCGQLCLIEGLPDTSLVTWKIEDGGNGHTYQAVLASGPEGITWTDANAAAEALGNGWHLATITSQEENDFVFSLIEGNPDFWFLDSPSGNGGGPYLGGIKVGPRVGDYEWVTGEPFVYTNWGTREPFGNGERIAFFGFQTLIGPVWNDIGPDRPANGYILETDQNVTMSISTSAPDLTASFVRMDETSNGVSVVARIGNGGAKGVNAGIPVSFYDGDPAEGGLLLGTVNTTKTLNPGEFEDVELTLPKNTLIRDTLWVVADHSGDKSGLVEECDETNNLHNSGLQIGGLDSFLFYDFKSKTKAKKFRHKSKKIQVTLSDRFTPKGQFQDFLVKEPVELGNPVDKNGEGIFDSETHLIGYKIIPKSRKHGFKRKSHQKAMLPEVIVTNQFGEMSLKLSNPPNRLLVPSAKSLNGPVPSLPDPPIDHFQCYGISRASGFEKQTMSVVDQFQSPKDIELVKPTRLCNPTNTNGDGIKNESQHLVCYKVRTNNDRKKRQVFTNNHLGPMKGQTGRERDLCILSEKQIVPKKTPKRKYSGSTKRKK